MMAKKSLVGIIPLSVPPQLLFAGRKLSAAILPHGGRRSTLRILCHGSLLFVTMCR
jgi:hypothetical protein